MAYEEALHVITAIAATNFVAADQYKPVKLTARDTVGLCTAAGEGVYGVLQASSALAGEPVLVCIGGTTKMRAGAAIVAGAYLTTNAAGKFATAAAGSVDTSDAGGAADALRGSFVCGQAVTPAGADTEIFSGRFEPMGTIPTTAI